MAGHLINDLNKTAPYFDAKVWGLRWNDSDAKDISLRPADREDEPNPARYRPRAGKILKCRKSEIEGVMTDHAGNSFSTCQDVCNLVTIGS